MVETKKVSVGDMRMISCRTKQCACNAMDRTRATYLVFECFVHFLRQRPSECVDGVNDGYHLGEHAHAQVAPGAHAHGGLVGSQLQLE